MMPRNLKQPLHTTTTGKDRNSKQWRFTSSYLATKSRSPLRSTRFQTGIVLLLGFASLLSLDKRLLKASYISRQLDGLYTYLISPGNISSPFLLFQFQDIINDDKKDNIQDNDQKATADTTTTIEFIRYTPSAWERYWSENIDHYARSHQICEQLGKQSNQIRRLLHATCTSFPIITNDDRATPSPNANDMKNWCMIDDAYKPLYFNTQTGKLIKTKPYPNVQFSKPQPIVIDSDHPDADLFSKMTYRKVRRQKPTNKKHQRQQTIVEEEWDEYIEPLVGILRHPLAQCAEHYQYGVANDINWLHLVTFRGHYIPPPPNTNNTTTTTTTTTARARRNHRRRYFYFDGGASSWSKGKGGPSLSYFAQLWKRHNISFESGGIYAYESNTPKRKFYQSLPSRDMQSYIHYTQTKISSSPPPEPRDEDNVGSGSNSGPFLPHVIKNKTNIDDYVLFKLDIDSPHVEQGTIDYLLSHPEVLQYIDEFFYEFHIAGENGGNYLLPDGQASSSSSSSKSNNNNHTTLKDMYTMFEQLRHRGVRAHSWI